MIQETGNQKYVDTLENSAIDQGTYPINKISESLGYR